MSISISILHDVLYPPWRRTARERGKEKPTKRLESFSSKVRIPFQSIELPCPRLLPLPDLLHFLPYSTPILPWSPKSMRLSIKHPVIQAQHLRVLEQQVKVLERLREPEALHFVVEGGMQLCDVVNGAVAVCS